MKLNDQIPGLPEWPHISKTGLNEYCVEAKHISYGRYILARWILRLAATGYFILLARHEFSYYDVYHWQWPASIVTIYFVAYSLILALFPLQRWICWLFLRLHTRVIFSQHNIVVNNQRYELTSDINLQFRANQALLSPEDCRREQPRQATYLLRFRLVEMIYEMRVVPIASFEGEKWANQFVVALQYAYRQSQAQKPNDQGKLARSAARGDELPE
jgi:hypothetical protein